MTDGSGLYFKCRDCGLVGEFARPVPGATYMFLCECGGHWLDETTREEFDKGRKENP